MADSVGLTDQARDEVHRFVEANAEFFARWYNGEEDAASLRWLEGRLADQWTLVNARIPGMYGNVDDFSRVFPTFHGKSADDPVRSEIEFKLTLSPAEGVYVCSYVQHFVSEASRSTHPETSVLARDGSGNLKVLLVHE